MSTQRSAIAQLVEQVTVNHPVVGSSPTRGARVFYLCIFRDSSVGRAGDC